MEWRPSAAFVVQLVTEWYTNSLGFFERADAPRGKKKRTSMRRRAMVTEPSQVQSVNDHVELI